MAVAACATAAVFFERNSALSRATIVAIKGMTDTSHFDVNGGTAVMNTRRRIRMCDASAKSPWAGARGWVAVRISRAALHANKASARLNNKGCNNGESVRCFTLVAAPVLETMPRSVQSIVQPAQLSLLIQRTARLPG